MPLKAIVRSEGILEQKNSHLIRKATTFDQKTVLQKLKPNSKNNYYYRFDEHLDMATIDQNTSQLHPPLSVSYSRLTFDNIDESPPLVIHKAEYKIVNGICSIKCSPGSFITNARELSLLRSSLSEIEIRLKARQGKELLLGLSSNAAAQWSERDKIVERVMVAGFEFKKRDICIVPLTIIPDNTFHTYNINIENKIALDSQITFDDMVRKIFISPPEIPGNEIEIEYIHFVTKKEKFSRTPFGQSYVNKNQDRRNVLYTITPCRLRYTLTLPYATPYLSFGTGCLEPNDPVEFMVLLKSDNSEKVLFQKTYRDPDSWTFNKLDLTQFAGKTVDVIFSTSSSKGNIAFWSNPIIYTLPQDKFNVIMVLEDALRADHLSPYGYTLRPTSPFREKFAQAGVVFENAFSQATETRSSCPSFMTSLFPTAAGAGLNHESLNENYLTLAEIMRSQGYATAAIIQNSNAGYYNGLHQGFSRFYELGDNTKTADIYGSQMKSWLDDKQGRNFFLYLHIIDPHGPYNPPPPFDQWYHEAHISSETLPKNPALDPEWVEKPTLEGRRLLYDGAVRSNDHWFKIFYEFLASRDLLSNTLIILISDHGENLGEHKIWGHQPPGYVQGIRVPLIMAYPQKLPPKKVIKAPVQLIDMMPTILDFAGIDKEELVLQGDSLLPLINSSNPDYWDSRVCFSEEVVNRSHKFDDRPFGSLIIANWHILNSKEFLPLKLRHRYSGVEPFFFKGFQYTTDREELQFINIFYFDFIGKFVASRVMKKIHKGNQHICQAFTRDEKKAIKSHPAVLERLRALGYLQ